MSVNPLNKPALRYYYDEHPTREDLMGESVLQSRLIHYLLNLLLWYYQPQQWFIVTNLNIYQTTTPKEYPIAPDIAVFKGVVITPEEEKTIKSWSLAEPNRPAPTVVLEICSDSTWRDDLLNKSAQYLKMGVKEYFVYDPNDPPLWKKHGLRLHGWRYSNGQEQKLTPDTRGWLWSDELNSWLVSDGVLLRLYDNLGQKRLTRDEAAWAKLRDLGIDPQTL